MHVILQINISSEAKWENIIDNTPSQIGEEWVFHFQYYTSKHMHVI